MKKNIIILYEHYILRYILIEKKNVKKNEKKNIIT